MEKHICKDVACNTKFMVGEEFDNKGLCPKCGGVGSSDRITFLGRAKSIHGITFGANFPAFMIPAMHSSLPGGTVC